MDFFDDYFDGWEPHGERVVGRWTNDDQSLFVDTCLVHDAKKPYETAVAHPAYNNGQLIIVEYYDTPEEALIGHARWEEMVKNNDLPSELIDVSNNFFSAMVDFFEWLYSDNEEVGDWRKREENIWIDPYVEE